MPLMDQNTALIIFVKNPEPGKVKTRIAKTLGDDKAVEIYQKLLNHTKTVVEDLAVDKYVFYGGQINWNDLWDIDDYIKRVQVGEELGEKMAHAFNTVFEDGYEKAMIIGSDCYELNEGAISDAINKLEQNDIAIGPTYDGGYYLLGMKMLHPFLFTDKQWSTTSVFDDTVSDIEKHELSYQLLEKLNDVDEEKDVPKEWL